MKARSSGEVFPGGPVVKMPPSKDGGWAGVRSLVGELRSHSSRGVAKKIKKETALKKKKRLRREKQRQTQLGPWGEPRLEDRAAVPTVEAEPDAAPLGLHFLQGRPWLTSLLPVSSPPPLCILPGRPKRNSPTTALPG